MYFWYDFHCFFIDPLEVSFVKKINYLGLEIEVKAVTVRNAKCIILVNKMLKLTSAVQPDLVACTYI